MHRLLYIADTAEKLCHNLKMDVNSAVTPKHCYCFLVNLQTALKAPYLNTPSRPHCLLLRVMFLSSTSA